MFQNKCLEHIILIRTLNKEEYIKRKVNLMKNNLTSINVEVESIKEKKESS